MAPMNLLRKRGAMFCLMGICAASSFFYMNDTAAAEGQGPFASHGASDALNRLFPGQQNIEPSQAPTGVTRLDYLKLVEAGVDVMKRYQNVAGAIIDPYAKSEIQYSTPSFAFVAGFAANVAKRKDLIDPACRALTFSLNAMLNHRTAGLHADFYIPFCVHAYQELKDIAPENVKEVWEKQFKDIIPENVYRQDLRDIHWNLASCSGELLRRKENLIPTQYLASQWRYLQGCLAGHLSSMTVNGMIADPQAPLACDEYSRVWLDDAVVSHAYAGPLMPQIENTLSNGALSTLLLLSPSGEWPSGGRSAFLNWTEALAVFICEVHANEWQQTGRPDVADAFKRAAHLAFRSVLRWQRPEGDLWILKNRAAPESQFGFETYANYSQFNILPLAFLALAYERANDSINEATAPCERGGYVFDVTDRFHVVVAAAGGYYMLIDTSGDPAYNATGLQRVHRVGIAYPCLSDSASAKRAYLPSSGPMAAIAPGIAWRNDGSPTSSWHSLADFAGSDSEYTVKSVGLIRDERDSKRIAIKLDYELAGPGEDGRHVLESYMISSDGVDCVSELVTTKPPAAFRAVFPALVSDGATDTTVTSTHGSLAITEKQCTTTWSLLDAASEGTVKLLGPRIATHSGYVQCAAATVEGPRIHYRIALSR